MKPGYICRQCYYDNGKVEVLVRPQMEGEEESFNSYPEYDCYVDIFPTKE